METSLTGCYLLVILAEPICEDHKEKIIQRVAKGLLSWNTIETDCDLKEIESVVQNITKAKLLDSPEILLQHSNEKLAVEVLISPSVSTLKQCMKNMFLSPTAHKHLIYGGYSFTGTGSWMLDDGLFTFDDFVEITEDNCVHNFLESYSEVKFTLHIHCSSVGHWVTNDLKAQSFSKYILVELNPSDSPSGVQGAASLLDFLDESLKHKNLDSKMTSTEFIGNIRFSRPTLYIFPSGQGDCSLFGVSGFTMLIDGGFTPVPSFWNFIRHLERLDAIMVTRLSEDNLWGVSSLFRKKILKPIYPQIGYIFCNITEGITDKKQSDSNELLISVIGMGHELLGNVKQIGLNPLQCLREPLDSIEPMTLYHKVGLGTLQMFILSPPRDNRILKEFLNHWSTGKESFSLVRTGSASQKRSDVAIPLSNLMSICCLLVWKPYDPNEEITRILFPGSAPQSRIFEGLNKIQKLDIFCQQKCTQSSLKTSAQNKDMKSPKVNRFRSVSPISRSKPIYTKQSSNESEKKSIAEDSHLITSVQKQKPTKPIEKSDKKDLNKDNAKKPVLANKTEKTIKVETKSEKRSVSQSPRKVPKNRKVNQTKPIQTKVSKSEDNKNESETNEQTLTDTVKRNQINDIKNENVIKVIDEKRETLTLEKDNEFQNKLLHLEYLKDDMEPDSLESIITDGKISKDSLEVSEDETTNEKLLIKTDIKEIEEQKEEKEDNLESKEMVITETDSSGQQKENILIELENNEKDLVEVEAKQIDEKQIDLNEKNNEINVNQKPICGEISESFMENIDSKQENIEFEDKSQIDSKNRRISNDRSTDFGITLKDEIENTKSILEKENSENVSEQKTDFGFTLKDENNLMDTNNDTKEDSIEVETKQITEKQNELKEKTTEINDEKPICVEVSESQNKDIDSKQVNIEFEEKQQIKEEFETEICKTQDIENKESVEPLFTKTEIIESNIEKRSSLSDICLSSDSKTVTTKESENSSNNSKISSDIDLNKENNSAENAMDLSFLSSNNSLISSDKNDTKERRKSSDRSTEFGITLKDEIENTKSILEKEIPENVSDKKGENLKENEEKTTKFDELSDNKSNTGLTDEIVLKESENNIKKDNIDIEIKPTEEKTFDLNEEKSEVNVDTKSICVEVSESEKSIDSKQVNIEFEEKPRIDTKERRKSSDKTTDFGITLKDEIENTKSILEKKSTENVSELLKENEEKHTKDESYLSESNNLDKLEDSHEKSSNIITSFNEKTNSKIGSNSEDSFDYNKSKSKEIPIESKSQIDSSFTESLEMTSLYSSSDDIMNKQKDLTEVIGKSSVYSLPMSNLSDKPQVVEQLLYEDTKSGDIKGILKEKEENNDNIRELKQKEIIETVDTDQRKDENVLIDPQNVQKIDSIEIETKQIDLKEKNSEIIDNKSVFTDSDKKSIDSKQVNIEFEEKTLNIGMESTPFKVSDTQNEHDTLHTEYSSLTKDQFEKSSEPLLIKSEINTESYKEKKSSLSGSDQIFSDKSLSSDSKTLETNNTEKSSDDSNITSNIDLNKEIHSNESISELPFLSSNISIISSDKNNTKEERKSNDSIDFGITLKDEIENTKSILEKEIPETVSDQKIKSNERSTDFCQTLKDENNLVKSKDDTKVEAKQTDEKQIDLNEIKSEIIVDKKSICAEVSKTDIKSFELKQENNKGFEEKPQNKEEIETTPFKVSDSQNEHDTLHTEYSSITKSEGQLEKSSEPLFFKSEKSKTIETNIEKRPLVSSSDETISSKSVSDNSDKIFESLKTNEEKQIKDESYLTKDNNLDKIEDNYQKSSKIMPSFSENTISSQIESNSETSLDYNKNQSKDIIIDSKSRNGSNSFTESLEMTSLYSSSDEKMSKSKDKMDVIIGIDSKSSDYSLPSSHLSSTSQMVEQLLYEDSIKTDIKEIKDQTEENKNNIKDLKLNEITETVSNGQQKYENNVINSQIIKKDLNEFQTKQTDEKNNKLIVEEKPICVEVSESENKNIDSKQVNIIFEDKSKNKEEIELKENRKLSDRSTDFGITLKDESEITKSILDKEITESVSHQKSKSSERSTDFCQTLKDENNLVKSKDDTKVEAKQTDEKQIDLKEIKSEIIVDEKSICAEVSKTDIKSFELKQENNKGFEEKPQNKEEIELNERKKSMDRSIDFNIILKNETENNKSVLEKKSTENVSDKKTDYNLTLKDENVLIESQNDKKVIIESESKQIDKQIDLNEKNVDKKPICVEVSESQNKSIDSKEVNIEFEDKIQVKEEMETKPSKPCYPQNEHDDALHTEYFPLIKDQFEKSSEPLFTKSESSDETFSDKCLSSDSKQMKTKELENSSKDSKITSDIDLNNVNNSAENVSQLSFLSSDISLFSSDKNDVQKELSYVKISETENKNIDSKQVNIEFEEKPRIDTKERRKSSDKTTDFGTTLKDEIENTKSILEKKSTENVSEQKSEFMKGNEEKHTKDESYLSESNNLDKLEDSHEKSSNIITSFTEKTINSQKENNSENILDDFQNKNKSKDIPMDSKTRIENNSFTESLEMTSLCSSSDDIMNKTKDKTEVMTPIDSKLSVHSLPSSHLRRTSQVVEQPLYEDSDEEDNNEKHLTEQMIVTTLKADYPELITISGGTTPSQSAPQSPHDSKSLSRSESVKSREKITIIDTILEDKDNEKLNTTSDQNVDKIEIISEKSKNTSEMSDKQTTDILNVSSFQKGFKEVKDIKDINQNKDKISEISVIETKDKSKEMSEDSKIKIEKDIVIIEGKSTEDNKFDTEKWGKPLGLPTLPESTEKNLNKSNALKSNAMSAPKMSKNIKKSNESENTGNAVYVELAYVPHHADQHYCNAEYFKRVRAKYYVFSGINPHKQVFEALIEGKKGWDKQFNTTVIPTHESESLGFWINNNRNMLEEYQISVAPAADRCTVNLEEHQTKCSAYRVEF